MKILFLVARLLLGLVFVFFGSNGFLHFLPMQMPPGLAGQFMGAMVASHYIILVAALQVLGGLPLLIGRFVPLGLTILGPIIVNILFYHLLMDPKELPVALFVTLLWLITAWGVRGAFAGILSPTA